jgi:DNA invertase Pin-like site-specific DNA recombinase
VNLRCAAYARYSTDRQNPLSTQDQLEKSREYAREYGFRFIEEHVYTDEEISGATLDRPGLRSLLAAAEAKPRPFDVLLIEDASRLSRKQADVLNLCERLSFAGVKIHFISQGIESDDEKFQLLLLARGMIDQLFLADTAKRVRRGLEGLIRRGLHTGGRCFGYHKQKNTDARLQMLCGMRRIRDEEAHDRYYCDWFEPGHVTHRTTRCSNGVGRFTIDVEKSASHHLSQNEIASDSPGGLKGSMQHWLAVYPPEFQIPMFFVAVD